MKVEEFKAWFEGYTEDMIGTPSITQWEKIKKKVSEIDGTSVNTVYIDRWYRDYYPKYSWISYPLVSYGSTSTPLSATSTSSSSYLQSVESKSAMDVTDTCTLMYNMGKADFVSEKEDVA